MRSGLLALRLLQLRPLRRPYLPSSSTSYPYHFPPSSLLKAQHLCHAETPAFLATWRFAYPVFSSRSSKTSASDARSYEKRAHEEVRTMAVKKKKKTQAGKQSPESD